MSINRFLSRREKRRPNREKAKDLSPSACSFFHGLFVDRDEAATLQEKYHKGQHFKEAKSLLTKRKLSGYTDEDIQYALHLPFTDGDTEKTAEFFKLIQDSENLILRPYNSHVRYLGAVNRDSVSCYLDSLLFAMFAYSDSFEMMLSHKFEDQWKNRLAILIRLWVNAQRSGNLVTTDITRQIQETLASCGWTDAREKRQQDVLEAYSFILEELGFPDLHLRMDIFHSGKEEADDDHKIVHERVLTMPIPEPREDGVPIKLEDCFELALIAKIDVRRRYEERRATITSIRSPQSPESGKSRGVHVDSMEVSGSEAATPVADVSPGFPLSNSTDLSRSVLHRAPSLIQDKVIYDKELWINEKQSAQDLTKTSGGRTRAGSIRKEVMMPAWQMYSLIPFHTDCEPSNDAEVAAHITSKQPAFCIALKRYSFGSDGVAVRRNDYVDIPLDMALPHFIQEDGLDRKTDNFEKFKISLQALVCHRGKSVAAGHYISLARIASATGKEKWALNDDLGEERVIEVDIQKYLQTETPYLLFYRVRPLDIPTFTGVESPSASNYEAKDSGDAGVSSLSLEHERSSSERLDSERPSFEAPAIGRAELDGMSSLGQRPYAVAVTDFGQTDNGRLSPAADQSMEILAGRSSNVPSRSNSKSFKVTSRSRPASQGGSKRSSISISRFTDLLTSRTDLDTAKSENTVSDIRNTPLNAAVPDMADVAARTRVQEKLKKIDKKSEEKRRQRLSAHGHFGKVRDEKRPDRECSIM